MKLLIDIPEKTIAHIRSDYGHGYRVIHDEDRDNIAVAIYHGIPLDDVKAEIQEKSVQYRGQTYDGLCIALKIIDKYIGNAESEE